MLADSHAHLDDSRFAGDRDAVLRRAWDAGVRRILTIGNGTGPDDMACGLALAREYEWIWTTVGVHPHDAARMEGRHLDLMAELASDPHVVAIGEAGLDYHYDNSPRPRQRDVFAAQIDLANRCNLPIVVHTRDAEEDTIRILNEGRPARGVIHCFTGSRKLAESALGLDLMISFAGILTFRGSDEIREVARAVPEDRLLIETDAPYLAPVPNRGRRNEPAFVSATAAVLADLRGVGIERLSEFTTRNFERLFGLV